MIGQDKSLARAALPLFRGVPHEQAATGQLERLPKWLNLIPMIVQWSWLSLRHGAVALPAAANPAITGGGLVGEGKSEYFRIMGARARAMTADFALFHDAGGSHAQKAEEMMFAAGLTYPLILKPDIGWCGFGVRLVRGREDMEGYLAQFPKGENIVMQRFVPFEGEAGIYYVRHPGQRQGRITGMLLRFFPRVVGDGRSNVAALIAAHPRVRRLGQDGLSEPCCDPQFIPAAGEHVRVSITGSTRVGGLYQDASSLITPALEAQIDAVARDMEQFHVGRFDVRYESLGALQAGTDFKIIEVNGAGSEAVHAWDPGYSLVEAYRIVFEKQRLLFAIGADMRRRGHQPPSALALARLFRRQAGLIRRYPRSN